MEGATERVGLVTCRSQCEFTRLYVCYEVCHPALKSVIDIRDDESEIDLILGVPSYKGFLRLHALSKRLLFACANIGENSKLNQKISLSNAVNVRTRLRMYRY